MSAVSFPSPITETPVVDPEILSSIPGFEDSFSADTWTKLSRLTGQDGKTPYLRIITVPPGVAFIKKGELDMHIFIILEGTVEAILRDDSGKTKTAKKCHAGDCVGELAVIEGTARAADVIASGESHARLLKIDWSITEKNESWNIALPFVNLVLRKIAHNTRAGYEAIGRVIEKAGAVMKSHDDAIKKLQERNRVLSEALSAKETLISQMRQALLAKGVDFDTSDAYTAHEEIPADINIDAAISLLQGALSQLKTD